MALLHQTVTSLRNIKMFFMRGKPCICGFPNLYGPYVDTAGKNAQKIQEYIRHQLDEGKTGEQLTMGNF